MTDDMVSDLEVVTVDGKPADEVVTDRKARRLLRRATGILEALRQAGVVGTVEVNTFRSRLFADHANVDVVVRSPGSPYPLHVMAGADRRGRIRYDTARVGVSDGSDLGLDVSSLFDLAGDPDAIRSHLVRSLMCVLAPRVWEETTEALGSGRGVSLATMGGNMSGPVTMWPAFRSSAGYVIVRLVADGSAIGWGQNVNGRWVQGDGAFGEFLVAAFRDDLEVEHEREVFVPFMTRLAEQARATLGTAARSTAR